MTISDTQFQQWLERSGELRCCLFRLTFVGEAGTPGDTYAAEYKAYVSNMPYVTDGAETPANQIFDECVLKVPTFTRRMNEQLSGRSSANWGDLIISNADNVRGSWFSMNWDGRRIEQWLGDPSWPFADFRLVLDGIIDDIYDAGARKIGFRISDKASLLNRPVMTTVFGGSGPLATKILPLAYGELFNISPELYDDTNHIYRVTAINATGSGPTEELDSVWDVRENGASLTGSNITVSAVNAGTDTLTASAAHGMAENTRLRFVSGTPPAPFALNTDYWVIAAGLTTTDFRLSATRGGTVVDVTDTTTGAAATPFSWWLISTPAASAGSIQLEASPAGTITADVTGVYLQDFPSAGLNLLPRTAGEIIQAIIGSPTTNSELTNADISSTSLSAFNDLCPQWLGIYITEQRTFAEVFDELVLSVGGWWGFNRAGLLEFGRLDLPVAGTPAYSFIVDDVAKRTLKRVRRILPRAEVKVEATRNWTVQAGELAGSVTEANRAMYGKPSKQEQLGVFARGLTKTWNMYPTIHKGARFPGTYRTLLFDADDALDEADRLADLFNYPTAIWGFETTQVVYLLKLGDLIYLEHDDFTGYGIVTAIEERPDGRSRVEFFAQEDILYPTADIA